MKMKKKMTMRMITDKNKCCSMCGATSNLTEHHLIPKSIQNRKKIKNTNKEELTGKTIPLCFTCHSTLHSMFTEKELSENFYSIELIKQNTQLNNFIQWKLKHPNITNFSSKQNKHKGKIKVNI